MLTRQFQLTLGQEEMLHLLLEHMLAAAIITGNAPAIAQMQLRVGMHAAEMATAGTLEPYFNKLARTLEQVLAQTTEPT